MCMQLIGDGNRPHVASTPSGHPHMHAGAITSGIVPQAAAARESVFDALGTVELPADHSTTHDNANAHGMMAHGWIGGVHHAHGRMQAGHGKHAGAGHAAGPCVLVCMLQSGDVSMYGWMDAHVAVLGIAAGVLVYWLNRLWMRVCFGNDIVRWKCNCIKTGQLRRVGQVVDCSWLPHGCCIRMAVRA